MRDDGRPAGELDCEIVNARGRAFTIRELRDRVTLAEPRVVLLREIEGGTTSTLGVFGEKVEELTKGLDAYSMVVDLGESADVIPTPEYRRYIPDFFGELHGRSGGALRHVAVVFHGNAAIRVALKFLSTRMVSMPISFHANRAVAFRAARAASI